MTELRYVNYENATNLKTLPKRAGFLLTASYQLKIAYRRLPKVDRTP